MNLPIADKIEKEINFMSIEHKEITDTDLHGISIRNSVISECLLKNVDLHNSDLLGTKPPCLAFGTTINETWWAEGC